MDDPELIKLLDRIAEGQLEIALKFRSIMDLLEAPNEVDIEARLIQLLEPLKSDSAKIIQHLEG